MKKFLQILIVFLFSAVVLYLMGVPQDSWGWGWGRKGCNDSDGEEIPFADASLYFELNNTDGDLGIHSLIDGDPWKRLCIEDPRGRKILDIKLKGRLRRQGLTELFFESAEPSFDELAPETFFRRFPAGTYEIEGVTLEGQEMESEVEITHLLPAPPANILVSGIPAAESCDDEPLPTVPAGDPVVISWDPVTHSHPELGETDEPIEVEIYQVVIELLEPEEMNTTLSVDLPPSETEFEVPAGFISMGTTFKFEVLVREESGNQTAAESCFLVE